jgi:hypothetical protein
MLKLLKDKVFNTIKDRYKKEFDERIENEFSQIKEEYLKKKADLVENYEKLFKEKKLELENYEKRLDFERDESIATKIKFEKANNDLKEQIKLFEAKVSPNEVYVSAVTTGFNMAFGMMKDIIRKGTVGVESYYKELAYDEALKNIQKIVDEKISKMDKLELKTKNDIVNKKKEMKLVIETAKKNKNKEEQTKFENYLEVLNWELKDEA